MIKNFNIPGLFFLMLFISKEIFSYDSEKVVIFCILFFIILAYYNSKEMLYNTFITKSLKLKEEYLNAIKSKENLELELETFWSTFLELENQLIKIYQWLKLNFKSAINKANKNRKLVVFHMIKDQLNLLVKEQLKINQNLSIIKAKNSIFNMKAIFYAGLELNLFYNNNLTYYFNKIIKISTPSNIVSLILNKIQNNKEFTLNNKNWTDFNTFLYIKYNLQNQK